MAEHSAKGIAQENSCNPALQACLTDSTKGIAQQNSAKGTARQKHVIPGISTLHHKHV